MQLDEYQVPVSISLHLAGLQAQADYGNYDVNKTSRYAWSISTYDHDTNWYESCFLYDLVDTVLGWVNLWVGFGPVGRCTDVFGLVGT